MAKLVPHAFCDVPVDWTADFSQCLYEWQGLEAGLLALAAAIIGARFIVRQIRQTDDHRQDELRRDHRASRVALPLTLAAVSELVQKMADEVAANFELLRRNQREQDGPVLMLNTGVQRFEPIELPAEIILAFQDFVKSLNDEQDVEHVAQLLVAIQILLARYHDFDPQKAAGEAALLSLYIDCARVGYLNDCMFSYARLKSDKSFCAVRQPRGVSWDAILGKAHSLLFFREQPDPMMKALNDFVAPSREAGANPWLGGA